MDDVIAFVATNSILVYMVYCFLNPPKDSIKFSDKFEIGYIDEPTQSQVNKPKPKPKPKAKQVKVDVSVKEEVNPIFNDCRDVLVSLGVPKRKAKAEVEVIFERNPNIKTVQEFITEYGKK